MNTTFGMQNTPNTTGNTAPCYTPSETERKVFSFLYLVIIIFGIPCNLISLHVSWQYIRQRNDLGVYLFSLALSDLSSTAGVSLLVNYLWYGHWFYGNVLCYLTVILIYTNFYTSDGLLCCIAMNRYLAVVHPLKYTYMRRRDTAVVITVAIWVLVVSCNTVAIIWVMSEDGNNAVCFHKLPMSDETGGVSVIRGVLGFIFPVLLVSFCCRGICTAVRSNRATDEQERKRVFKLLGVVLLTLTICFGPIHIMMAVHGLLQKCKKSLYLMYKVSVYMSALNSLADPFLYCFITRLGKAHITQVVHFLKRKERNSHRLVRFGDSQTQTRTMKERDIECCDILKNI